MAVPPEAVTDVFSALADSHRRDILSYLAEEDAPVAFDSLARRVAAGRTDRPPDTVDDATLTEARIALHHKHLPKLAEHGFITYEVDPGEIALTDDTDALEPFLGPAESGG